MCSQTPYVPLPTLYKVDPEIICRDPTKTPDSADGSRLAWDKSRKAATVNATCAVVLVLYIWMGAFAFVNFEREFDVMTRRESTMSKMRCVRGVIERFAHVRDQQQRTRLAHTITSVCIVRVQDPRQQWNLRNAALYAFGIVTTLGYGKIEPLTINGRIFTVIYGFVGIPFTVIIFANLGRYIQRLEQVLRMRLCRRGNAPGNEHEPLPAVAICITVCGYLLAGASLLPFLNGEFDFFNGIYWAFLCFTAINYGELIPQNYFYLPIAIAYICLGLALSTIALDVGSVYVRKLHFIGQKIRDIANVTIWFGSKSLNVEELVNAIAQNIGIEPSVMREIDLDSLVTGAIKGIWPPELVPLFIKDGNFPQFVDDDRFLSSRRPSKRSISTDSRKGSRFRRSVGSFESL